MKKIGISFMITITLVLLFPLSIIMGKDPNGLESQSNTQAEALSKTNSAGQGSNQVIIIDHTTTDLSAIPDYWIEQAKALSIHYAHTSHGSQLMAYLSSLETLDSRYDFSILYAESVPPSSLNCDAGVMCIYDGNPPETYITPEDYWQTETGMDRTRAVADTGLFGFSMWSWCGQASTYSTAQIQDYLDALTLLETEYPGMRFILMTGHTDGGENPILIDNNNLIRQYAWDHGMVLYDFADIESYDPDGVYYPNTTDACSWCSDWCDAHPEDCQDLPSCAHSHGFNCKLKGYAFWWMMARLAGWSGEDFRVYLPSMIVNED